MASEKKSRLSTVSCFVAFLMASVSSPARTRKRRENLRLERHRINAEYDAYLTRMSQTDRRQTYAVMMQIEEYVAYLPESESERQTESDRQTDRETDRRRNDAD